MNKIQLNQEEIERIQTNFHVSALCAKVLASKQLSDLEIMKYLKEEELCDPMEVHGVKESIALFKETKAKNEKVLVCGDYDSDGICATAILFDALCKFGITAGFYIPNRLKEGYGLHPHTVEMAHEKGYQVLVTVDNGVKALPALLTAKQYGMKVIVTDHHSVEEEVPCDIFVHPSLMKEEFQVLCGAGIALQLARALIQEDPLHVVLACVASIADVMTMKYETRAIVKKGIWYLNQGVCPPLQEMRKNSYVRWDESEIAFSIVPKLNATGRLAERANANNTVKFLLSQSKVVIQSFAKQLDALNELRKELSQTMVEQARTMKQTKTFQILYDPSFHEGIIGLVAGKLSEEWNQPVMVLSLQEGMLKGSIRSQGKVDLRTFFDDCKPLLSAYGGHKEAAGIALPYQNLTALCDYVWDKMETTKILETETIDAIEVDPIELSVEEIESLRVLAPFGHGFEEPLFVLHEPKIHFATTLKDGLHLKWSLQKEMECLLFHAKEKEKDLLHEPSLDFIGHLKVSSFMGRKKMNLFVNELEKANDFSENICYN